MTVTSVGVVTSDANARAGSVGYSSVALVEDTICKITKANTTSDSRNTGALVKVDGLEGLKINHHRTVLATGAKACIRVATRFGLNLETSLAGANHGILNMLVGGRKDNNGWLV